MPPLVGLNPASAFSAVIRTDLHLPASYHLIISSNVHNIMMSPRWTASLLCLLSMQSQSNGFSGITLSAMPSKHRQTQSTSTHILFSMPADDYPSDYDVDDIQSTTKTVAVDDDENDATIRDELKRELVLLASVTNRGMCSSTEESNLMVDLVTQLEALNPT